MATENREVVKVGNLLPNLYYNPQPDYVGKAPTQRNVSVVDFTKPLEKLDNLAAIKGTLPANLIGQDRLRPDDANMNEFLAGVNEKMKGTENISSIFDLYNAANTAKMAEKQAAADLENRMSMPGAIKYNKENYDKIWGDAGFNTKVKVNNPETLSAYKFLDEMEYARKGGAYNKQTKEINHHDWTKLQDHVSPEALMDIASKGFESNIDKTTNGAYNKLERGEQGQYWLYNEHTGKQEYVTEDMVKAYVSDYVKNNSGIMNTVIQDAETELYREGKERGLEGDALYEFIRESDYRDLIINKRIDDLGNMMANKYGFLKVEQGNTQKLDHVKDSYEDAKARALGEDEIKNPHIVLEHASGGWVTENPNGGTMEEVISKQNELISSKVNTMSGLVENVIDDTQNPLYNKMFTPEQKAEIKQKLEAAKQGNKDAQEYIENTFKNILKNPSISSDLKSNWEQKIGDIDRQLEYNKQLQTDAREFASKETNVGYHATNLQTQAAKLLSELNAKPDADPKQKEYLTKIVNAKSADEIASIQQQSSSAKGFTEGVIEGFSMMFPGVKSEAELNFQKSLNNFSTQIKTRDEKANNYISQQKELVYETQFITPTIFDSQGNVDNSKSRALETKMSKVFNDGTFGPNLPASINTSTLNYMKNYVTLPEVNNVVLKINNGTVVEANEVSRALQAIQKNQKGSETAGDNPWAVTISETIDAGTGKHAVRYKNNDMEIIIPLDKTSGVYFNEADAMINHNWTKLQNERIRARKAGATKSVALTDGNIKIYSTSESGSGSMKKDEGESFIVEYPDGRTKNVSKTDMQQYITALETQGVKLDYVKK